MLAKLKALFKKAPSEKPENPNPQMWEINGTDIKWFGDFAERRIVGWRTSKPSAGDFLKAKMQTGKTGIFKFVEVELCGDPPDMFFATVKDYGYEGEVELPEIHTPQFRFL